MVKTCSKLNPQFRAKRFAPGLAKYGITPDQYNALLDDQNGVCAICYDKCITRAWLCVDHDHKTGKVRGLLCSRCNTALGLFKDDVLRLCDAVAYLIEDD